MSKFPIKTGFAVWLVLFAMAVGAWGQTLTNNPPSVSITSPPDGSVASPTNALFITVQAADADGTVVRVDLYRDGQMLASADTAPYEFELINLADGTNIYTAAATDNSGAVTFSSPVVVFEQSQPPSYYAPYINFTSPGSNSVIIGPTNLTIVAQVTDLGFPVREVNFAVNNHHLGSVTTPPFSWTLTNLAVGSYTFGAIVTDGGGNVASAPALPVTLIPDPAITPVVSLVNPTNGASATAGQILPLTATVITNGNVITRVTFHVGSTTIGSVTNPPYTLNWQPSVAGPYCAYAVAAYGQNLTVTSTNVCFSVVLPASPHYVVVDLGPLQTNAGSAFGINGWGHLVGDFPTSDGVDRPLLDIGGFVNLLTNALLTPGYASAINNSDQVLVNAQTGQGYRWQNGLITDLGSLGQFPTHARAINASGLIVGDSKLANGNAHAFLYNGGGLIDLGTLPGGDLSQANAINDLGVVAGWSQNATGQSAFTYDATNGMLAVAGPGGTTTGNAWGINNSGNLAGDAYHTRNATRQAFIRINGTIVDLGTLAGSSYGSSAKAINNSNQVVGISQTAGDNRGFLWMANVLYDLNALTPTNSSWSITAGTAINDAGQIVGTGRFGTVNRAEHVVLLNPLPTNLVNNLTPAVAMMLPTNQAVYPALGNISLAAAAGDQDGFITNVTFYAGNQWLGSVTNPPPFTLTWSNVSAGTYQLTAVGRDNLGASQTSAPVTIHVNAPYPGAPKIAIVSAGNPNANNDVRSKLINTILLSGVDLLSVTASDPVPTLAQLLAYDAVLVYSAPSVAFNNPTALGNLLADYVDAGHGVVLALFTEDSGSAPLGGRLVTQTYTPWSESHTFNNLGMSGLTLVKILPQHPILAGVQSFNGGGLSYFQYNMLTAPGTITVALWNNGNPLVATRQVGAGRLVGLNFFPPSSDVTSSFWVASTDGAKLMANALTWAAGPMTESATLTTRSNLLSYYPGQNIDLTVNLTNFVGAPQRIDIYTNGAWFLTLTNAPFTNSWLHPAMGSYLTTAVVTDAQMNVVTTPSLLFTVNSRISVSLLTPVEGATIYYPTNQLLTVSVADLDAPIKWVDYYIDGTQLIYRQTNAPWSYNWNVQVVGAFPMTVQVTDKLGGTQTSAPHNLRVLQNNPGAPVQTTWIGANGDWFATTNWSNIIPRSQDTAVIDNGATASLHSGQGAAANLTVGLNATGAVVQSGASLTVGQMLTLGQNAGSAGYFELDGPGRLAVAQLFVGLYGAGHFVQKGGSNLLSSQLLLAGNGGSNSVYELYAGQMVAYAEYVENLGRAEFFQYGGTNTVLGLEIGRAGGNGLAGTYFLQGGLLKVADASVNGNSLTSAQIVQSGGTLQVTENLAVGDQGEGRLTINGGHLSAAQLTMSYGAWLDLTIGSNFNTLRITNTAQLGYGLTLRLDTNYFPAVGDVWPLITFGRNQGTFSSVTLPPATNGVAWQITYQTNQLVLTATKQPTIIVVGPVTGGGQTTNLFAQVVTITNPGPLPLSGARVFFPGLPTGVQIYNATGSLNGVPYIEYEGTIAPGNSIQLTVQFFTTSPGSLMLPRMVFGPPGTNQGTNGTGLPLRIDDAARQADGSVMLHFNADLGQVYYVQYSGDLNSWTTVTSPIIGIGSQVQWVDDGPPKSQSHPQNQPARYYRILRSP